MVALVAVSKVVLVLELVANVLIGVRVDISRGCVCSGKCWIMVMSSTIVRTKQELVVAPSGRSRSWW